MMTSHYHVLSFMWCLVVFDLDDVVFLWTLVIHLGTFNCLQHVDEENSYLCGYLKITGLTFEYPMLTTFFDGEIISKKYPFLTRKWDADEDVDRKHWVSVIFLFLKRKVLIQGQIYKMKYESMWWDK